MSELSLDFKSTDLVCEPDTARLTLAVPPYCACAPLDPFHLISRSPCSILTVNSEVSISPPHGDETQTLELTSRAASPVFPQMTSCAQLSTWTSVPSLDLHKDPTLLITSFPTLLIFDSHWISPIRHKQCFSFLKGNENVRR